MRALFALWKREPLLGALAVLGTLLLVVYPVYLSLRVYVPVWTGAQDWLADFSFYYEAAERFLQDPHALYPDPYGFMYPPPSVLLFLPLVALPLAQSLVASILGIAVLAAASVWLVLDLYEAHRAAPLPTPVRVTLLLIGLATAPVFQNLKYGQVNVFVLFLGLAFLALLQRDRPFAAALVLSVGFWLKLYPLGLALLGLRRGQSSRLVAGFAVGLVAVPVVVLPFIPFELYRQYAFDLVPYWASVTNVDALNQSITGVLEHVQQPIDNYLLSRDTPIGPGVKVVNLVATLGLLGGIYGAYFTGRLSRIAAGVLVLAVLPVISGLGWEHTYVLALPLFLFLLLEARHRGRGARAFAALAVLVFMLPKLPQPQMEWTFAHWPRAVVDMFYARFLIVTLLALAVGAVWLWVRRRMIETTNAPAAGAAEALPKESSG